MLGCSEDNWPGEQAIVPDRLAVDLHPDDMRYAGQGAAAAAPVEPG